MVTQDSWLTEVSRPAAPAESVTEILLPKRHCPDGYQVTIRSGQVILEPGAELLLVSSQIEINVISVSVTE